MGRYEYTFNAKGNIDNVLESMHFRLNVGLNDCPCSGCSCHQTAEILEELLEFLINKE